MAETGNIRIIHGDDHNAIREQVAKIAEKVRETGLGDFNLTILDGKDSSASDFNNAVLAAPFMTDQRVVILNTPLAMAGGRDGNKKFTAMLEEIPETTILYLVIPDAFERKDWVTMGKTHFLRKWVEKNPGKGQMITCQLPAQNQMPGWIMKKAVALGGQFSGPAAGALSAAIGNDTQLAENEVQKLLLFVNYARPVDADDVNELVTGSVSVSIFDMVDSLVSGKSREALRTLHRLMEDEEIPMLFSMIVRQFRLLVQVRAILDKRGSSQTVQSELGQVPFVADKLVRQANAFTAKKLNTIYHRLLEMDHDFKTSGSEPEAAMDLLILDVATIIKSRS